MNHHKQRTGTNACIDFSVYMYNIIIQNQNKS